MALIRQPDLGQHGEGDMAIPTVPIPHLIAVEADLALGFLDDLLDRIARARHPCQSQQGGGPRGPGEVVRQFLWVAYRPASEQPHLRAWEAIAALDHAQA